jgi:putative peptidoglycan lipid II flippase
MSKPLLVNQNLSLGRASAILAGLIFLSRLAGFGRNVLTSALYGTGPQAEAFNAAFAIPEVISIVIAGGALATGFVPTFSGFLARGEHDEARRTFRALLTLLMLAGGALTLALLALTWTPFLNRLVPDNVDGALYFANLRILLVAQFFFVVGGVFTGTFNSMRLFWWPALQPVFFNVGIIIAGFIGHKMGYGVTSQAWGALGGAIVGSILVQVPIALRAGLSVAPLWDVRDEGVQKVMAALVPVFFGLASGRILSLSLPAILAAGAEGGGATTISNASRLMILPLELLASGSAIAIFPTLSALAAKGETAEVGRQLRALLRRTLKLLCIAVLGLWIVAVPLLLGLVKGGQFSGADSVWTGKVLLISALSLPGLGAQQLIARGFYALGDNATPVKAGVGAMLLFAVLALLSNALGWGTLGVTGASVVAVSVLGAVLWKQLQKKLGNL